MEVMYINELIIASDITHVSKKRCDYDNDAYNII